MLANRLYVHYTYILPYFFYDIICSFSSLILEIAISYPVHCLVLNHSVNNNLQLNSIKKVFSTKEHLANYWDQFLIENTKNKNLTNFLNTHLYNTSINLLLIFLVISFLLILMDKYHHPPVDFF